MDKKEAYNLAHDVACAYFDPHEIDEDQLNDLIADVADLDSQNEEDTMEVRRYAIELITKAAKSVSIVWEGYDLE